MRSSPLRVATTIVVGLLVAACASASSQAPVRTAPPTAALRPHSSSASATPPSPPSAIPDDGAPAWTATGEMVTPRTSHRATLLADVSGSIVIDIWKDTYANFPPTVADTITASAKPTLASAQKAQDSTLTGWTTTIAAGDILAFNVDSITTVTRVTLSLKVRKT